MALPNDHTLHYVRRRAAFTRVGIVSLSSQDGLERLLLAPQPARPFASPILFATCAEILEEPLPSNAAEDSVSFLSLLSGATDSPTREATIHQATGGLAIRKKRMEA